MIIAILHRERVGDTIIAILHRERVGDMIIAILHSERVGDMIIAILHSFAILFLKVQLQEKNTLKIPHQNQSSIKDHLRTVDKIGNSS